MRFLLACSLLTVQLAFIRLVWAVQETVAYGNVHTNQWIVNRNVINGKPVSTAQGQDDFHYPLDALFVRVNSTGAGSRGAIANIFDVDQNLYVGVSSDNKTVVWSDLEFSWEIASEGNYIGYRICLPGEDFCWFSEDNHITIRLCDYFCQWQYRSRIN